MYLLYVDESGDPGMVNSPTSHFVLSGLAVHESRWQAVLRELLDFRRRMRQAFGLKVREEIHASAMLSRPGALVRIRRNDRVTILRAFADQLAAIPHLRLISVAVDKRGKSQTMDVLERAWTALIQRFEDTLRHGNFPGPFATGEGGMIIPDNTDGEKLRVLMRRMRHYNPIPDRRDLGDGWRNHPLERIIEDPFLKRSEHPLLIQGADCAAYLLYQRLSPSAYARAKSLGNYYRRLRPILCTQAAPRDHEGLGIVRI